MSGASYTIRIGSTSDTAAIDRTTGALRRADAAADEFVASIKAGVGIDIGGRLVSSLASIPGVLSSAISRGVEFNATMQDSTIGIANVLAKFQGLNKEAARAEAAKAMQQIIALEPRTAAGLGDLVQGFMATVAASQSAGVSVEQNIDLVAKFANALANANIPAEQLSQELRSIFTGNITADSALAKILEITNADIAKAKEAGTLYDFLVGRIGSIGEAGDSAAVRLSSLNSAIDKALGEVTKPIFDAWVEGLSELTDAAGTDAAALTELGTEIAKLVREGTELTAWLVRHPELLAGAAKAVGWLVAAWAAFKLQSLLVGLAMKTRALLASSAALGTETAALNANTAAQRANAAARGTGAAGGAARLAGAANAGLVAVGTGLAINAAADSIIPSFAGGGKSSRGDLEAAASMRAANSERVAALAEQIKGVTDKAQRDALMQEMAREIQESVSKQRDAGFFEEGRTAQNQALSDHAAALRRLVEVLQTKGSQLASPEQTAARLEEEQRRARAEAQARENEPVLAAARARASDQARDRFAAAGLDKARAAATNGDTAGASRLLAEQKEYFEQWKSQVSLDPSQAPEALKANLDLVAQLDGYLRDIAQARKELPEAIAAAEEKARDKEITALQDQLALIGAQGEKRLADLEAATLSEEELARRRKAVEDEIAARRLAVENQIGALQGESAVARQAREIAASASQTMRDTALAQRRSSSDLPTPGGRFANGRVRGTVTSDAFERNVPIGQSLLDNYLANRAVPVGALNGKSILPADPLRSLSPTTATASSSGEKSGGSGVGAAAEKAATAAEGMKELADPLNRVAEALGAARAELARKFSDIEQKIAGLSKKV